MTYTPPKLTKFKVLTNIGPTWVSAHTPEDLQAAYAAGLAARVPDGWKLAPTNPSVSMINAGLCGCMDNDVTVWIYETMLAAAPEPKP